MGRGARARARAPPHPGGRRARRRRSRWWPTSSTSSPRTWPGTAAGAPSSPATPRGSSGLDDEAVAGAPAGRARPRDRHDRRAELDLGQARPAHARRVRPGRAAPDAHRADAAPLAGPGGPEPGGGHAPRAGRRVGLPQGPAAPAPWTRRPGCWPPPTSTWGSPPTAPTGPPSRPRTPPRELRRLAGEGVLDPAATDAVLAAAGHARARPAARPPRPAPGRTHGQGGRGAAPRRPRADDARRSPGELYISPKTADHHIQHVYSKIGVSTRAAAALWAMQNAIVA